MGVEPLSRPRLEIVRDDELPEPTTGDMLGPYRLHEVAGEGGMGRVFRAEHVKLGRAVAVKLLSRRHSMKPGAIARFLHEARAANQIHHPNIVEITDIVEGNPGGDSYYIMEFMQGADLASRLSQMDTLPAGEVMRFGRQIASAMAAVHRAGYIHQDLKPENCFVAERHGRTLVKIIDFGVARTKGTPDDGMVAGTPVYFAPEAAAGREIDERSDIYSLGVMLYELLSGSPPFYGETLAEYVMKHMTLRPLPVEAACQAPLPPGLAATVNRCLEKDPPARFQSMEEVEQALARSQRMAAMPGQPSRVWPVVTGLAIGLLTVLGLSLLVELKPHDKRAQETDERIAAAIVAPSVRTPAPVAVAQPATSTTRSSEATHSPEAQLQQPLHPQPQPSLPPARSAALAAVKAPPAATASPASATEDLVPMRVSSIPSGAEILRDGKVLGVTPCTVSLPRGVHHVDLRLASYGVASKVVYARPNGAVSFRLRRLQRPQRSLPGLPKRSQDAAPQHRDRTIDPFAE